VRGVRLARAMTEQGAESLFELRMFGKQTYADF
jgi:hypothetical protein